VPDRAIQTPTGNAACGALNSSILLIRGRSCPGTGADPVPEAVTQLADGTVPRPERSEAGIRFRLQKWQLNPEESFALVISVVTPRCHFPVTPVRCLIDATPIIRGPEACSASGSSGFAGTSRRFSTSPRKRSDPGKMKRIKRLLGHAFVVLVCGQPVFRRGTRPLAGCPSLGNMIAHSLKVHLAGRRASGKRLYE